MYWGRIKKLVFRRGCENIGGKNGREGKIENEKEEEVGEGGFGFWESKAKKDLRGSDALKREMRKKKTF